MHTHVVRVVCPEACATVANGDVGIRNVLARVLRIFVRRVREYEALAVVHCSTDRRTREIERRTTRVVDLVTTTVFSKGCQAEVFVANGDVKTQTVLGLRVTQYRDICSYRRITCYAVYDNTALRISVISSTA